MYRIEKFLDHLFGWVDSDTANMCFTWTVRSAYVVAVLMLLLNIGIIIDIYNGIPTP